MSGAVQASLSPTAALRAYYRAAINKDIETAKKYLSAGTLRAMEEGARQRGKSLDEAMRDEARWRATVMPKLSNERITGTTAAVDVTSQGITLTMPLVKEDGEWKLALDKMLEVMRRQTPPPPPAAEGDYSEDEKHRLFQAVGITQDADLIIEVAQKIGIVNARGEQNEKFEPFIKAHLAWAKENMAWVQEHRDKAKARAYVMANK
ncbi:MAG TPA: hypothetical protein VD861_20955 [Pyrinomonadaceae bacterium]|nr:hypothetical protein [Pyrinomonadaceae bacterium]